MDQARDLLLHFTGPTGYAFFYGLIMSCGMGAPFNSDFCLITASVLASLGYFDLRVLMVLAFFALLSGDTFTFYLGRKFGKSILAKRPFCWLFKPEKIALAEHFLRTRGERFLFVVRFLPLIRTVLFFTAGSLQVRPKAFYLYNAIATAIYLPILMSTAFFMSENIEAVLATLKKFQFLLMAGLIVTIAIVFIQRRNRSRQKEAQESC
jgi:membrane protein DedA with SNARE-associated domain